MTVDARSTADSLAPADEAITMPAREAEPAGPDETATTGLISTADWRSKRVRRSVGTAHFFLMVLLVLWGLLPMYLLAKLSITPIQETLKDPLRLWPANVQLSNLSEAWTRLELTRYFKNTIVIAIGSWLAQLFIATTAGYALSILKPRYATVLNGLVIATLFIPAVVLLIPLYLTILEMPITHWKLLNTYWAIWLPAGANAFNVLLVKRFFDNLPREIFEAARVDGAGPFRLFVSMVLPMSRPILGVVSVFAFIATWRDFLWPSLVIGDVLRQPLSVRLALQAPFLQQDILLAGLFLSTLLPVLLFLAFQRMFLRNAGLGGAVKG